MKLAPMLTLFSVLAAAPSPALAACEPKKPPDPPTARFEIHGSTVYDTKTRLTWRRCSLGQTWEYESGCAGEVKGFTWNEAGAAGEGGWRIPTQKELASLVAKTCSQPAINEEVFPGIDLGLSGYWTSTPDGPTRLWYINFSDGSLRTYGGSLFRNAVRLVRSRR